MNKRLCWLTICLFSLAWILPTTPALAGHRGLPPLQETATEEAATGSPEGITPTPAVIYPVDIINAVNDLRIQQGLPVLAVHQALMDIAAQTANQLALTEGASGHYRPCNLTLGQMLLMRGFALWGDLSQDGYRSENWGIASSAKEIVESWLMDEDHANTMLSPNRSHIGAAVSDQTYMVIVTALQVPSGKMQWGADKYLTQAAVTQAACAGLSTRIANGTPGDLSQYSVPVVLSTARPDGDVIHEVQYGQTLWSIAIEYHTTIEQIKRLNNLTSDTVVPGWTLLVKKGATQPVPSPISSAPLEPLRQDLTTSTVPLTSAPIMTATSQPIAAGEFVKQNSMVVVAFVISFSILVAAIVGFRKKKEE